MRGRITLKAPVRFVAASMLLIFNACAAPAHAADTLTLQYKAFPTGIVLLPAVGAIKGCLTGIEAPAFIGEPTKALPPAYTSYRFIFWNVNGVGQKKAKGDFCSKGADTFVTAWYVAERDGKCESSRCFATTWAFSLDTDRVLGDTTPIASVAPNIDSAWTPPSTTVFTRATETIAARAKIILPFYRESQVFRFWLKLPDAKLTGLTFTAAAKSAPEVIAFYGRPVPAATLRPIER
jgi:hypothetical protein